METQWSRRIEGQKRASITNPMETMANAMEAGLASAASGVADLLIDAKRYSTRTQICELGTVAEKFATAYASLSDDERENLRVEHPGLANKRYSRGWIGAWDRMVHGDPESFGDANLCGRMMVRYLKFAPIARELVRRDRRDAIPLKIGGTCSALQRALRTLTPANGAAPDIENQQQVTAALADGFVEARELVSAPLTTASAHVAALDGAIERACIARGVEIGDAPVEKPKPRKRARTTPTDSRAPSEAGENGDGASGIAMIETTVNRLVADATVAREVVRRLGELVPDVCREVMARARGDSASEPDFDAERDDDHVNDRPTDHPTDDPTDDTIDPPTAREGDGAGERECRE